MTEGKETTRKFYEGAEVTVSFDSAVCEHAGFCVKGLPAVFDTDARPWINPEGASADEIREQVARCPSGALRQHPGTAASGK